MARLVERDAAGTPDDLGEWPVGHPLPDRGATAAKDLQVSSLRRGASHHLPHETALPDARIPVDHRQPRHATLDDLIQERLEDRELPVASHHARLEVAARPRLNRTRDGTYERVGDDRKLLALERELRRLAKGEGRLRRARGALARP